MTKRKKDTAKRDHTRRREKVPIEEEQSPYGKTFYSEIRRWVKQ